MTAIPASIPRDGSVDVTTSLTNFFNGLADNDTVDFTAASQYRVDGTVDLVDINGQTWNGGGSRLFAVDQALGNPTRAQVRFTDSANLTIRNLVIEGGYPTAGVDAPAMTQTGQHALEFRTCFNVLVQFCEMHETMGDGIHFGRTGGGSAASGCIVVNGNYITGIGGNGIGVSAASGADITQNTIDDIKKTCIDLEHPLTGYAVSNMTIVDNFLGRSVTGPVNGVGALGNLVITDNLVDRLGFRFQGTNVPQGAGRAAGLTYVNNHAYKVVPDGGTSTWMIVSGFTEVVITDSFMQFGGTSNNFHRFLQLTNAGTTELSRNFFIGLQPNRLYTVTDGSPVTESENYFWPLGYAVVPS